MKARIRRKNRDIPLPEYGSPGAAAFDLAASESIVIQPREIGFVKTGLFIECPSGHFLAIFSRSSTPRQKGLTPPHGVGILDSDYSGPDDEVMVMVYNFTDSPAEVKAGERIAQGIFLPTQKVEWEEADTLSHRTRGGFGSTGAN